MISFERAISVLENHIHATLSHVPAGISSGAGASPKYSCTSSGIPSICKCSDARNECFKFYETLPPGENECCCPFGISLSYLKVGNAPVPVAFFIQTAFSESDISSDLVQHLPRRRKKRLKNAMQDTAQFTFRSKDESSTLNQFKRILETLLAGRVAASMRTLTHQILTPVQGALNDIAQVKIGKTESISLLESNIEEIGNLAKRIHVLLSESTGPSPQTIRHVNVHKVLGGICGRLNSLAVKKELRLINRGSRHDSVVEAVPDQLDIAFRCILENAVKYSFYGTTERGRDIQVSYAEIRTQHGRTLEVRIVSRGCPITELEINERMLFQLGYRGQYSGDRGRQGTGSGLFIADRIVTSHKGQIEVSSVVEGETKSGDSVARNEFVVKWPKFSSLT